VLVGGTRVRVAVAGTGVMGGKGVAFGVGVFVDAGRVGDGAAVQVDVSVGGMGVGAAVCVCLGVSVPPEGSGMELAVLIEVASASVGWRAIRVGVAAGEGAVAGPQPRCSPPTTSNTIKTGMHLPKCSTIPSPVSLAAMATYSGGASFCSAAFRASLTQLSSLAAVSISSATSR
jgi:hypothetical protein